MTPNPSQTPRGPREAVTDYDDDPETNVPWCQLCSMHAVWCHGDLCPDCAYAVNSPREDA